ncbi:MAG: hypothetical protein K2R93_01720 [Gemmatimonadaceae bacterium]|nr:hypothetical protein [Gemmatimonadaceae bacterium]
MAPSGQSYKNHAQFTPAYHYFTSPISLIYLVWTVKRLISNPGNDTAYALVGALAITGLVAVTRLSPLRVQDRLIRLEEQLRYAKLLPAEIAAKAESTFSPRHYIALRFASDAELPELVNKVLANPSMTQKEIKQAIKNWRGDYFRA